MKGQVRHSRTALPRSALMEMSVIKIYHATCHDEAGQATSLASRLRLEMGATSAAVRSRSRTPERLTGSPLTRSPGAVGKLTGVKRKAEDESPVKFEPGLSPKRVAV